MKVYFLSKNQHKIEECRQILSEFGIDVGAKQLPIDELQTNDTGKLVKDKLMKAFESFGRPLFIERTGLYLSYLNGFPGGLTQIFWDTLGAERFAELFGNCSETTVKAITVIGYTDGIKFHVFSGEIEGSIPPTPRGPQDFQWDCVFVPIGETRTFAEMGEEKNKISMRKKALREFARFLSEERRQ